MVDEVSGQAAQAGDDQTPDEGGHEIPIIPDSGEQAAEQATPPKKEGEEDNSAANDDAKSRRISGKKWQEMVEKVKDFDDFKTTLAESLGVKIPDEKNEDTTVVLQKELESLKEENKRKDWEVDHPEARKSEEWSKIVKEKGHLVRSGDLSYDDLWRLVRKEQKTETPRAYREQELAIGSVPTSSKSPVQDSDVDPDVEKWMKDAGYTDAAIKFSGKRR